MNEKKYIIEVSHVNKSFKNNKVLKDVTLRCESGRIYGLVGHNGSGKTVLFKTICGFLSCDEGTVSVNGKVVKPSYEVKVGDIIEIQFGDKVSKFEIIEIPKVQGRNMGELIKIL